MADCVLIGGVFDPLHAGHLAYIRTAQVFAAERGLTVACALSDAPEKHPPLVPIHERAALIRGLGVDFMVGDVISALNTLRPKAYIKGDDWRGHLPQSEVNTCALLGIDIIHTATMVQSSSALLAEYERRRNAEKLAQLEAWMGQQTPAEKPWEPVTDYSFEARKEIEGPHAALIKEAFAPESVLDVGCGPGHLVRMLREAGVLAYGEDSNPQWRFSQNWMLNEWFTVGDLAGYEYDDDGAFTPVPLVICREVLEHLTARQLPVAVRNLVKLSSKFVYLTTRFTSKPHLLDFDAADDLDPTHQTMLHQDLLRTLFVLEGCRRCPDLEAKLDHRNLGRVLVYEVPA